MDDRHAVAKYILGCLTCKAKRLKCDEVKPTCQQCQKRNVPCGGYKKDFKWRAFEETAFAPKLESPSKGKKSKGVHGATLRGINAKIYQVQYALTHFLEILGVQLQRYLVPLSAMAQHSRSQPINFLRNLEYQRNHTIPSLIKAGLIPCLSTILHMFPIDMGYRPFNIRITHSQFQPPAPFPCLTMPLLFHR